jgi:LacI family transcriptional regulator
MRRAIRIGLVFSYSLSYCRAILRGIKRYAQANQHWIFAPVEPDAHGLNLLKKLRPTAVIAHIYSSKLAGALQKLRVPLVNVCGVLPDLRVPRVGLDDVAIGRAAAQHLLDRGLRDFGFVGHRNHGYSIRRQLGFEQTIHAAGCRVTSYHESSDFLPRGQLWSMDPKLLTWLKSLPKPTGVMACNDLWGAQISEACRQCGLAVPEQLAIVGVDNDDLLCELARPSLSSVAVPAESVGYHAAELLDRLIAGRKAPTAPVLLPPGAVETRCSSDILSISDTEVADAIRAIRQRAHEPLRTRDVLAVVPVSRRSLERRFRKVLGRGIAQEIRRARLDKARALLAGTDMPMSAIACCCGFGENKHLSVAFRRATGMTPSSYRSRTRGVENGQQL